MNQYGQMSEKDKWMTDFLYYAVFKCTKSDMELNKDEALTKCVHRAYRDFCRTLSFNKDLSEQDKDEHKIKWEKQVGNSCCSLLASEKGKFDESHKKECDKLRNTCNESGILNKSFTDGQAQKWMNMTLKYMVLTGLWDENSTPGIESCLHVPVDNYILSATSNPKDSELNDAIVVRNNTNLKKPYSSNNSIKWSQWDYDMDYMPFITSLRTEVSSSEKFSSLFQWENYVWLKMAPKL